MKLFIDINTIISNIKRAESLVTSPSISLMMKEFYEDINTHLSCDNNIFSKTLPSSVCYSLEQATKHHRGALITSIEQYTKYYDSFGIREFYIPIDFYDGREGLNITRASDMLYSIHDTSERVKVFGLITSGCISANAPTVKEIEVMWPAFGGMLDGLSLGGSYYLQFGNSLPSFITDVRIGEYMLYGTIPYCDRVHLFGDNALTVQLEVLEVYRERREIIVKGGYSHLDTMDCTLLSGALQYKDISSDYTIYTDAFNKNKKGDMVELVPNYKSLVKLRYVPREYKK